MPPLTGDYSWSETATILKITVPLHNVPAKQIDCVTTCDYIKISYGNWLIHLDLFGMVDDAVKSSKATVKQGILTLKTAKAVKGLWGRLEVQGKGETGVDQTFLKERRAKSLEVREVSDLPHT